MWQLFFFFFFFKHLRCLGSRLVFVTAGWERADRQGFADSDAGGMVSGTDLGVQGADGYAVGEWCENKSVFAFGFSGLPCLFPPFFLVLKVFFGAPTLVRLSPGSLQQQFLWEGRVATRQGNQNCL